MSVRERMGDEFTRARNGAPLLEAVPSHNVAREDML